MEGVPHGRGRAHSPHRFEVGQQGLGRGRPHAIIYRDGLMAFAALSALNFLCFLLLWLLTVLLLAGLVRHY